VQCGGAPTVDPTKGWSTKWDAGSATDQAAGAWREVNGGLLCSFRSVREGEGRMWVGSLGKAAIWGKGEGQYEHGGQGRGRAGKSRPRNPGQLRPRWDGG
jgi:hypothetical protein